MSTPAPTTPPKAPTFISAVSQLALAITSCFTGRKAKSVLEKNMTTLERYRQQIDSFDEDREDLGSKLVRKVFTFVAFIAPFLVAYFIGKEIGDYYSGPLNLDDGWSGGMHVAAWVGEASLAMMVISTARAWRQYKNDPLGESWLFISSLFFILFTLASCFAQWVIAYNHIHPHVFSDYAALIFRVSMPTTADIACMLWLGIMRYKSLKQYLSEKQQKAQAIQLLNEVEISIKEAEQSAERRNEQAQQAIEIQRKFSNLVLQISEISGEGMIEIARLATKAGGPFRLLEDGANHNGARSFSRKEGKEDETVLE